MIRAILDEVVPADVAAMLRDEVLEIDPFPEGWRSQPDGFVLRSAVDAGYDWLITCDKHMPFQQNLSGRPICVLVLPTPRLPEIERIRRQVSATLRSPVREHFIMLDKDGLPIGQPMTHRVGRVR